MQISLGKYRPQLLAFIEAMRTEYGLPLAVPPNKVKKTARSRYTDILYWKIWFTHLLQWAMLPNESQKKGFWRNPTKKTLALFSAYRTEEGLEHTRLHLGWLPAWGEICQRIHFSLDFTQTKRNLVVFCESSCWFLWDTYCNFWKRMTVHFFQTLKLTVRTPPPPPPKKKTKQEMKSFPAICRGFYRPVMEL